MALDAVHTWYELSLASAQAPCPRRADLALDRAGTGPDDDALLTEHTRSGANAVRRYREEGGTPWTLLEHGAPVFSCWTFPRRTPAIAARGGWLEADPGVVFLEESVTFPGARGRGLAPYAWLLLAVELSRDGARRMVTVAEADNRPVDIALLKAGFVRVARSRTRRRGPRTRVSVEVLADGGRWLGRALAR